MLGFFAGGSGGFGIGALRPEVCGAFVPCPTGAPGAPDFGASTATPD
jgi:hypothetical protein